MQASHLLYDLYNDNEEFEHVELPIAVSKISILIKYALNLLAKSIVSERWII